MSRLDFLYRTELPHRAVAVYIYLANRAALPQERRQKQSAVPAESGVKKQIPPPRGKSACSVTGATCHGGRRK